MLNWVRQSFYRQILTVLLLGGFTITGTFGVFDFLRERAQLQDIIRSDASHLADTLSLVLADDVFYRNYFELWTDLNTVFLRQRNEASLLYSIREISVTDNDGRVLGHTNPAEHPLLMEDKHQQFSAQHAQIHRHGRGQVLWLDAPQPSLLVRYPVYFSNEKIADITLDLDPQPLLKIQRQLILTYLVYELLFMLALLLMARFLARRLARPLEQVSNILPLLGSGTVQLRELHARSDELKRLASVIEDVDQRIYAAQLAAKNRQAELQKHVSERTREIEAFTYSVSHDLRSPLRAMDGFSQALLEDYADKLDADGQDYLRRICGAAVRMGEIIDDLLMLSRVNRQQMEFKPVDLSSMARKIIAELAGYEPERTVDIVVEDDLQAHGDARLLRIALTNLLSNAWKYTAQTERPRIEFCRIGRQGRPVFMLRDNGAGFDGQYAEKIFGAFQRLHGRDEYEGTGIGLTIVQRIIHRHHGEVWAEGTIGKGAAFYFSLGDADAVSDVAKDS